MIFQNHLNIIRTTVQYDLYSGVLYNRLWKALYMSTIYDSTILISSSLIIPAETLVMTNVISLITMLFLQQFQFPQGTTHTTHRLTYQSLYPWTRSHASPSPAPAACAERSEGVHYPDALPGRCVGRLSCLDGINSTHIW